MIPYRLTFGSVHPYKERRQRMGEARNYREHAKLRYNYPPMFTDSRCIYSVCRMRNRAKVIGYRTRVVVAMIREQSQPAYFPLKISRADNARLAASFDHSRPLRAKAERAAKDFLGKRRFN